MSQFIERNINTGWPHEVLGQVRTVASELPSYLNRTLSELDNPALQTNTFSDQPWGSVLSRFTRDLKPRLEKTRNLDELGNLISPIVMRGMELVSGGVVSTHDLSENTRRGLSANGTWPDAPGAHFWDPREFRHEQKPIQEIVRRVLELQTDASQEHIGRVITMSLPALFSWSDLRGDLTPQDEIIETTRRLLASEQQGELNVVSLGCEPYQYGSAPNTTTGHVRRSEFGNAHTLRPDAIAGSFRGIRRILEPLTLSGVSPRYDLYTSFGSSWELIQRQVMPDTVNFYSSQSTPEAMLAILSKWKDTITHIGEREMVNSGIEFSVREMETAVILPALKNLGEVLGNCGMTMPDNSEFFYYNSGEWFAQHAHELNLLTVAQNHPDPKLLMDFLVNEEHWSRKHPQAYNSEQQRTIQASLLSFFELHQYERINEIINSTNGFALGIEIDEELIMLIRQRARDKGQEQVPLIWGRPPRFTKEGIPGGVGHRQPWYYEKNTNNS